MHETIYRCGDWRWNQHDARFKLIYGKQAINFCLNVFHLDFTQRQSNSKIEMKVAFILRNLLFLCRPKNYHFHLRSSSMSYLRINSWMAVKHIKKYLHVNATSVCFMCDGVCFSERELDYIFFFPSRPDRPFMIQ